MSIWLEPDVDSEPEVILVRWGIFLIDYGPGSKSATMHFVGHRNDSLTGRVSTPILEFDLEAMMTGRSRSGRVYRLLGSPGVGPLSNAMYVLQAVARSHTFREITSEVIGKRWNQSVDCNDLLSERTKPEC
jgi:hypothetical protein